MLEGNETCGMEDKSVSTSDDFLPCHSTFRKEYHDEKMDWNILAVEKLLTALINTKLMSIRRMPPSDSDSERSCYYYPEDFRDREPPDKRTYRTSRSPRQHRCSKHDQQEEQQQRSCISKVQKWSDDLEMETTFVTKLATEETSFERPTELKTVTSKDGSTIVEIERKPSAPRKKRRKKRKRTQRKKKISRIDPEDLPKRARWTIIITSGLLILTCMFLVGITLRMAPVIDQMVRTQNEELMNSLNRNTNPSYYSSIGATG
ncbi:hypothetical protein V9T40_008797 [Parthenolecanium corni]|uniref:Uncharacterized protein n=1 Tax=Parthenolecanium corni TaxID=536013 RepID=A0AAN9Y6Y3_9HEMI